MQIFTGNKTWTLSFSQTFRRLQDIPANLAGYPAKKRLASLVSRDILNFLAPTLHLEDPHPTGRSPDQEVWVCVPFSCLILTSFHRFRDDFGCDFAGVLRFETAVVWASKMGIQCEDSDGKQKTMCSSFRGADFSWSNAKPASEMVPTASSVVHTKCCMGLSLM